MFRFSCFHSPAHFLKPKKIVQLPTEAMQKTLEDYNTNKPNKGDKANPFPSSADQDKKSEGLKSMNDTDSEHGHEIRAIRKCVSVGTGLAAYQDVTSGDDSYSSLGNRSGDEYHNARASVSPQISSNLVNNNNNASDMSSDRLSGACTGCSSSHTPAFVKSNSLPYMHLAHTNAVDNPVENDSVDHADKSDADGDEVYEYAGSAKDWIVPGDEPGKGKTVQEDYSGCQWEGLPTEDFKIRRVEKWVMDLQHSSSLEETDPLKDLDHQGQDGKNKNTVLDPIPASKNDPKSILGMDAAKRYISSLNPAATSAQLANHGLAVVPFLSAFSSLRALNLSGNSIVRITVGALPRGLHILNLSKNSISTIEGLRELTKLRVLDLSYNRILRIGQGLATCSTLKELYLAGNKISEVEGLHRLLKLSVLDLRFNKLSTTKSLGQLAANYGSLQAISLEGNPAQKNIGDEQLKKFVLSLFPHINYYNRKSIKSGSLKDSSDRGARHGIRSESKKSTRGRRSQVAGSRRRHVKLPPSGRHQFPDVSSQVVSFRPDLAMRRAHSEGMLRAV